ncbi:Hypothetical predicted protein [Cloeon dipterum]|uniref:Uncharacterized protein n=1 Tax=Cloeon dipterum TaxID=197152 RepID=A0A8S1D252_9INSE|nr:Hypothetical predicted protein [Cloeon dipterum]
MASLDCPEREQFDYKNFGEKFDLILLLAICQAALLLAIFIGVVVMIIWMEKFVVTRADQGLKSSNECKQETSLEEPTNEQDSGSKTGETKNQGNPEPEVAQNVDDKLVGESVASSIRVVPENPLTYDYAYVHGRFCSARFNGEPEGFYERPIDMPNM